MSCTDPQADASGQSGRGASLSRGRILRLKEGYNPNSSSMGSIVFALPAVILGASVIFGAAAGLIASAFLRGPRQRARAAPPRGDVSETAVPEQAVPAPMVPGKTPAQRTPPEPANRGGENRS